MHKELEMALDREQTSPFEKKLPNLKPCNSSET